jgi:hypothetical protein
MEWQPIETAPKDGTTVLTYPHYIVTHFVEEDSWNGPGWAVSWEEELDVFVTMSNPPTHWLPLKPPEGT